jgi:PKD-like domain/Bacterial Ig-like domain (group 2)
MKKLFTLLIALFSFLSMSLGQTATKPVLSPSASICLAPSPATTPLSVSFTYSGGLPNTSTTVQIQLGTSTGSVALPPIVFGTAIGTATNYTFTTDASGSATVNTTINLTPNAATDGNNRVVRIRNSISTVISPVSDQIGIRIQPTADAGLDLTVCQSSAPTAITLGGIIAGGATQGAWSIMSGGGTLSSTTFATTYAAVTYTPVSGSLIPVVLKLTSNNLGNATFPTVCSPASDTRIITINPEPTLGVVSATSACLGSDVTVTAMGLLPNTSGNLIYTLNGGSPITIPYTTTTGSFSFPITAPANNDVVAITNLDITSTTCSKGFSTANSVTLVVKPNPVTAPLTGPTSVCVGTPVTINSSLSTTTLANYSHSWLVTGSAITTPPGLALGTDGTTPLSFASFTPATAGTINVTYNVSDANGCTAAQQVATVTVTAPPVPFTLATIPPNCDNGNFTLAGSLAGQPATATGMWSVMIGTATITPPLSNPTAGVTGVSGTAVLKWTVMNGTCGTESATVTLTNQMPRLSAPFTATVCSGSTFTYSATGTPTGASFTWSRAVVPGISQGVSTGANGNISEVLTNTTNSNVSVTYVFTVAANGCTAAVPENVVVTVRPKPNVTTAFTAAFCSGGSTTIAPTDGTNGTIPLGTTYSWPAPVVTGGITGGSAGLAASLLGNISTGSLTNSTAAMQTATYTVTPSFSGCPGSTFTIVITVNPKPNIPNIPATATTPACSGVAFAAVMPVIGTIPSGTTYSWSAPLVTGGMTGGMAGTGSSITGTLVNTSLINQTATYSVTPTVGAGASACPGAAFTVAVTIKPTPTLTSLPTMPAICSGAAATYTPTGAVGATFAWTRAAVSGITEPATGSAGAIMEILHNTTVNPIVVTYNYIVTLNGCVSVAIPVTVTVNPLPVLSSSLTATTCSGDLFIYTATSATLGATFTWSRAAVMGITEPATSGTVPGVGETLTNTTTAPINVMYVFTTTANGCSGSTQCLIVTVNPKPVVNNLTATICSGDLFTVTPQNGANGAIPVGTTYSWSAPVVTGGITGGLASPLVVLPALPPTSITGTLTNPTRFVRTATYTVTPSFAGCAGAPFTVTVTVNPKPLLADLTAATCSGTAFAITPPVSAMATNIVPVATTYTWSAPIYSVTTGMSGGNSSTATNVLTITETLTNTTTIDQTATYTVTPTASATLGGCVGATFEIVVTVKPTPVITGILVVCKDETTTLSATPIGGTWSATGSATVLSGLVTGVSAGPSTITYTAPNGCSSSVTVTVNAKPVIAPLPVTTCAGSTFALIPPTSGNTIPSGTTYTWSAPSVTPGLTGGVGGTNATIISGTLANSTNTVGTATYTVTPKANGCAGADFTVTVTVDPKPAVTVAAQSICSGTAFSIMPSNGANGIVPVPTTYTWTAPSVSGISGTVGGTNASSFATGTLLNSTTGSITVTYSVTPKSGSCTGAPFNVVVTVKPAPIVTAPAMSSTCNGGMVTVALTGTIPVGTTYAWSGGTGLTFGPLSNLGSAPAVQTFLVTPTFGGCPGASFNVPITVNPTPTVTGTLTICKGLTTQLTGSTAGSSTVTPAWSSASMGVATVSATGLVTGVSAGSSVITYTDNNGCQKMVTVTINANPTVAITTTANFISQGCTLTGVTATITGGAGGYSPLGWSSNPNTLVNFSGGVNVSASVKSTSINALSSPAVTVPTNVTINFEANDLNSCVTEATPLVLTVYPALTASVSGSANLCIGGTETFMSGISGGNATGTGTGIPAARTIVWASNSAHATVSQTGLVTGFSAGPATISVTVTDASGCSATSSQVVTIKAAPALTAVKTDVSCFGSANGIICLTGQLPLPTTYTYAWSNGATTACNPGLVPGTYVVTITDNSIACPLIIPNISITEPQGTLSAAIAASATAVCQTTPASLTFTGSGGLGAYTFTYTKGGVLQPPAITSSGSSVTVPVSTAATGPIVYALVDVTSGACNVSASGTVTITVDASLPALIPTVNAGSPQSGLLVNTTTLTHSAIPTSPSGLTGTWSVVPTNSSVTFTSLNVVTATTKVENLPAGSTTLRWTISKGACKASSDVVVTTAPLQVYVTAYLQGPYDSTTLLMKDDLRAGTLLPTTSPYGGLETVNPSVFLVTGGDAIVDWVQVQLRTSPTTVFKTKPALIQRDGDVVGLNGTSPVEFEALDGGYHIAILHRNHLGAMSLGLKSLTLADPLVNQFDFTDNADIGNATYGTNAQKLIGGYRCMWAGDATGNGQIRYNNQNNDRSAILNFLSGISSSSSLPGYYKEDINMNGIVKYNGGGNDRSIILSNLGGVSSASIFQQF